MEMDAAVDTVIELDGEKYILEENEAGILVIFNERTRKTILSTGFISGDGYRTVECYGFTTEDDAEETIDRKDVIIEAFDDYYSVYIELVRHSDIFQSSEDHISGQGFLPISVVDEIFMEEEREELYMEGFVEREMMKSDRSEQIYPSSCGDLYLCNRVTQNNGDTFIHKPVTGATYASIMEAVGFPGYHSAPPKNQNNISKEGVVPKRDNHRLAAGSSDQEAIAPWERVQEGMEGAEWFWPQVSYRMAEKLLNAREENLVIVRTSQTNPGQLALTAAYGLRGHKRFKHFHVQRSMNGSSYKLGDGQFETLPELVHHFVESNRFKVIPYFVERSHELNELLSAIAHSYGSRQILAGQPYESARNSQAMYESSRNSPAIYECGEDMDIDEAGRDRARINSEPRSSVAPAKPPRRHYSNDE